MSISKNYSEPKIVASSDLSKRSYVTFYLNDVRVREYNGKNIQQRINPNRAVTIRERNQLLSKLQLELYKALESGVYPISSDEIESSNPIINVTTPIKNEQTAGELLRLALENKLHSGLSKTYKRDLKAVYEKFIDQALPSELNGSLSQIPGSTIAKFLSQFGSSGAYYMNKRRALSILFNAGGKLIDQPIKTVKETERRKAKAKLHVAYEREQLVPILDFLKAHYHNLYICCLLTYSSWLRPHEEIRLLTFADFKKANTEIHLTGSQNKGGRVRVVHVPEYARKDVLPMLEGLKREQNIFTKANKPFNESYFNTMWSRAWVRMNKLGLIYENQTLYSFRHTAAIEVYRKTKDVYLLQKLLGHSSIVVTLKYLRSLGEFNSDELRDAAPQL